MGERLFPFDDDCSFDESFRLHYGRHGEQILNPCEEINDGSIIIRIVDNNTIKPSRLLLVETDYRPILITIPKTWEIVKVTDPGKSGVVFLNADVNKGMFKKVTSRILGHGTDRRDHLHTAFIDDIKKIGWKVYWAPLQMSGNMLHARLVSPNSKKGYPISEDEAHSLAEIFGKIY